MKILFSDHIKNWNEHYALNARVNCYVYLPIECPIILNLKLFQHQWITNLLQNATNIERLLICVRILGFCQKHLKFFRISKGKIGKTGIIFSKGLFLPKLGFCKKSGNFLISKSQKIWRMFFSTKNALILLKSIFNEVGALKISWWSPGVLLIHRLPPRFNASVPETTPR